VAVVAEPKAQNPLAMIVVVLSFSKFYQNLFL
jgi:hypothetical protein